MAETNRLRELLENLFRNGIEYGGEDGTVRIEALPTGFATEDDRSGIPRTSGIASSRLARPRMAVVPAWDCVGSNRSPAHTTGQSELPREFGWAEFEITGEEFAECVVDGGETAGP